MINKKVYFKDGSAPQIIRVDDEEDAFYGVNIMRLHGTDFDRKDILYIETLGEDDE